MRKLSADGEMQNAHVHMDVFQENTLKKDFGYVCSITEFLGAPFSYAGRSWLTSKETVIPNLRSTRVSGERLVKGA